MSTRIVVQRQDFVLATQYEWLRSQTTGAITIFSGLVRELSQDAQEEQFLELEHYPGMAEAQLAKIVDQARQSWITQSIVLIHRYGKLMPSEQIVLVGVGSEHRAEAFATCEFIMDCLKTNVPFWKKEHIGSNSRWIKTPARDTMRKRRWFERT